MFPMFLDVLNLDVLEIQIDFPGPRGTFRTRRPRLAFITVVSKDPSNYPLTYPKIQIFRVILGSLHVCVPRGTSLEQWERTEQYLQHCFEEYGISHVTISPEIQRDLDTTTNSTEDISGGCRLPCHDDIGCAVSELKKRKSTA